MRGKLHKVQQNVNAENEVHSLYAQIVELKETSTAKNEEIKNLNQLIDELNTENIDLNKLENMDLFDKESNSCNLDLHACVYTLLDNHVSFENVSTVIENVLELAIKRLTSCHVLAQLVN